MTYKPSVCTKAVLELTVIIISDVLLAQYCTAGTVVSSTVRIVRQVTKEDRLVGQRFILQQHNDTKHQTKRTRTFFG